ncbi:MAG: efflux RND transporter permease subunit [bacterium]
MNIGKFSVTRPVAVVMRIAALVLLGTICFLRLPIDLLPRVAIPTVNVNVSWPNTSPENMESQIARPIEQAVGTVKGMSLVSSTSSLGNASVRIQFNYGVDVDKAVVDVLQQVERAQGRFPKDPNISIPQITKFDPSSLPVLIYGVTSKDGDLTKLNTRLTNEISPILEASGGVASVTVTGGQARAIMVDVDPQKLQAYNLTLGAVSQRISQENVTLPAGVAQEGKTQYNIRSVGYFPSIDALKKMPLTSSDNRIVQLQEVADVRDANQDVLSYTRSDGDPACVISVTKQSDSNTVEVAKSVQAAIKDIALRNPDLKFHLTYDQAGFIEKSIEDLQETAIIGGGLAILIITFFLRNLRSTFVVALSIPISILSTFSLLYFCGFTLNTISLSGLALATGLIVDDAIVVLENIYRHIERDKKEPMEAAISGTQEILSAVLASTFTVMIVFLPLMLIQGISGQVFTQFALVVIFSIGISLLDAMTVVPMLASRIIKIGEVMSESHPELRAQYGIKESFMTKIYDKAGEIFHKWDESYRKGLRWALDNRRNIVIIGIVGIVISVALWPLVGKQNFPETDSGNLTVSLKLPIGTPVDKTNTTMLAIEKIVSADKDVESIISGAGTNVGLRGGGGGVPQEGSITAKLKENRSAKTGDVIKRLQKKLGGMAGARITVQPLDLVQRILGNHTNFSIDVFGQDLTQLTAAARQVQSTLSTIPGLQNVDLNVQDALPEIQWKIDREKAQTLGISFNDVANAISAGTTGQLSTYYQENGFQYPIYVQLPQRLRMSARDIAAIPLTTGSNPITLGQVATPYYSYGPNQINRQSRQRLITVSGNITGRADSEVKADALAAISKMQFPTGVYAQLGAQLKLSENEFSSLGLAAFLAIALIYMLLAAQFESYTYPLVVLMSVPLCAIGLVLAFILTDRQFGLTGFIGLLMLIGIAVKNGILLVDYTNQLREEGLSREEAILRAGPTRLRPILMTTMAAILGMVPLAIGLGAGSEMYTPLATAVIGGLITSTLLTLFVVPTVYTIVDDIVEKRKNKREQKKGKKAEQPEAKPKDETPESAVARVAEAEFGA